METSSKVLSTNSSLSPGPLNKAEILQLLKDSKLVIRPLLDSKQISQVGIDFRLGYDFLVSIQGREGFINASRNDMDDEGDGQRNINQFFRATRRQIGDTFILHPYQTVLAVSLEYIKLPADCMLKLYMRSSYSRLGITMSTLAQPGYCGCLSLELTNNNNNPINLTIGSRIIQDIFFRISNPSPYFEVPRKYICQVRPEPSAVIGDEDLHTLNRIWKTENKKS